MTYYGGQELARSFRTVRGNTIQIAEDIPESSYHHKAADNCRTIAQTLTHIAVGPWIQTHIQQNHLTDLKTVNWQELSRIGMAEETKPRTKAEIVALLKSEGDKFAAYLESLTESFLAQPVTMPPGAQPATKSRFEMLLGPKEHEMHHRGQLMVLQRTLGLTPHLTRQMQERSAAQTQAAQPQATR